ncbi:unnamed protein product, partial [Callosobruchus maculatus]
MEHSYRCPTCNRSYMLRRGLDQHIKYQCGKEPQFICPYAPACLFRTCLNGDLKKHIFWRHQLSTNVMSAPGDIRTGEVYNNTKVYDCNTCGKPYKHYPSLWRHKKYECQKEPAFLCYFCNYKAKQKVNLNLHILNRHKDKFINSAETIAAYSSTIYYVDNKGFFISADGRFVCYLCKRSYKRRSHLKRHIENECIHSTRNYECQLCHRRFKQKTHLDRHIKAEIQITYDVFGNVMHFHHIGAFGIRLFDCRKSSMRSSYHEVCVNNLNLNFQNLSPTSKKNVLRLCLLALGVGRNT